ncbi:MAG: 50S ribosomal protein L25 [Candidatus Omnitrophota bacterium]
MEKVILTAEVRQETGKSHAKHLRRNNLVPAVCYRGGKECVSLKVGAKALYQALHTKAGENVLITLNVEGAKTKKERTVLVKEVQVDPIRGDLLHVDFNEISLTEKIKVKVPVTTHGEAKEVQRESGVVEHTVWEVEVECLPTNIPEKIQVEIEGMKIGDTVHIGDLKAPEGVKILGDPELIVLIAKASKVEVVEEVPVEGEAEEPEVIAKGKKPEEEGEEEDAEAAPQEKKDKKE